MNTRTKPKSIRETLEEGNNKVRVVSVDMTPTTDFYMIVRQEVDAEGYPMHVNLQAESSSRGFDKFPGYMYSDIESAEAKCVEYMKQRASNGQRFRYFVMRPVSVVVPKF